MRQIRRLWVLCLVALLVAAIGALLVPEHPAAADSPSTVVDGWGRGGDGQLCNTADPQVVSAPQLLQLPAGQTITQVATNDDASYFLTSAGAVYACGGNQEGELGNGQFSASSSPVLVQFPPGTTVTQISAAVGSDVLALTNTGIVYEWGSNAALDHNNPSNYNSDVPLVESFPGDPVITQVFSQENHQDWAISSDGQLYWWEAAPSQVVDDPSTSDCAGEPSWNGVANWSGTPVVFTGPSSYGTPISVASSGGSFEVVLYSSGTVIVTGYNGTGILGTGSSSPVCASNVVDVPQGAVQITATGESDILVLENDGSIYAWGDNSFGQVGDGSFSAPDAPVLVPTEVMLPNGASAASILSAGSTSYAVDTTGALWGWGGDASGQLGNGNQLNQATPTAVDLSSGVVVSSFAGSGVSGDGWIVAVVQPMTQTITFTSPAPSNATFGGSYQVSAIASGGGAVSFEIDPSATSFCSVSGSTVSFTGVGNCVIDAAAAGDASNAPAMAQQSFSIGPAAQSISYTSTAPTEASYQGPTYAVSATASSGLPVSVTVDPAAASVCSVSGSTLSFIGVGTCTVDADQSGNADWSPAITTQQSFTVLPASQTLGFTSTAPAHASYQGPTYAVSATASSGLPVSFTVDPAAASVCSASGSTVSFIGVGTCTVDADQSGSSDYSPAAQVKQSFGVGKATPDITWAKPSPIRYGTALSSKQLDAAASVPGTFSFMPGSGTVLAPGPQTLSVAFKPIDTTDYSGASASVTIYVDTAPVITSRASVDIPEGSPGRFTVTATGAPTPLFAEIGHLPSGVTFVDHRNGTATLSGTPKVGTKGTYTITIEASNGVKPAALQSFALTVSGLKIVTTALPTGTRGHHYSVQLQATGGVLPLKWTMVSLPPGLTLSTGGLLSGTPSTSLAAGSHQVVVNVKDSTPTVPQSTTKTLTLSLT